MYFSFAYTDGIDEFSDEDYEEEDYQMVNSGRGTKVSGSSNIQMPLARYKLFYATILIRFYADTNNENTNKAQFKKPIVEQEER